MQYNNAKDILNPQRRLLLESYENTPRGASFHITAGSFRKYLLLQRVNIENPPRDWVKNALLNGLIMTEVVWA